MKKHNFTFEEFKRYKKDLIKSGWTHEFSIMDNYGTGGCHFANYNTDEIFIWNSKTTKEDIVRLINGEPAKNLRIIPRVKASDLSKEDRFIWKRHFIAEMKKMDIPVIKKMRMLNDEFNHWVDDITFQGV